MNERFDLSRLVPATTTAAEGLPRRAWRRSQIEAMVEAGILDEDERFELIGGEVVPMSPKGARHEWVKLSLSRFLQRHVADEFWVGQETTLWLDDFNFVEPDFCVFPASIMPTEQKGQDVLLAIEIGDSSLAYDLGRKIGLYAAYGVAEVWVIDSRTLVTQVHRQAGAAGYASISQVGPETTLVATRVAAISVCLQAIGLSAG